ncbi:MAG: hypothetical protein PHW74_09085 [Desulfobacca sp.]|nr:hypothetical protein [Desulfobacca sp.]
MIVHVELRKKQQKPKKGQPRGRPLKPGQSGNPKGRLIGSLNKLTLAVLAGSRAAVQKLAQPIMLDKSLPYECWGDRYVQFGREFRKDTFTLKDPDGAVIPQPEMLDIRKFRQPIIWKNREYLIQDGWLFDRHTYMAVKI